MHLEHLGIDGEFLSFNMNMDRAATMNLACCVLHNFCEIYVEQVPLRKDVDQHPNPCVGVRRGAMRLFGDGRTWKIVGEQMRATNFVLWVGKNPNV